YSTPWRMVARNIRAVTDDYVRRMRENDSRVSYGFALDGDERRRRFVIQSLLYDGLDLAAFRAEFATDAREAFAPVLEALAGGGVGEGMTHAGGSSIRLTAGGVRHADVGGQFFFPDRVNRLITKYEYDTCPFPSCPPPGGSGATPPATTAPGTPS